MSIDALRETIDLITRASEEAAVQLLHSAVFAELDLPPEFLEAATAVVQAEREHAFWLESVEPGSSKFKGTVSGFILYVLALTISGTGSKMAFDVIKDTEAYRKIKPEMVEITDQYTNLVVEYLRARSERRDPDKELTFKIERVADRLRIHVMPSPKQREYITLG